MSVSGPAVEGRALEVTAPAGDRGIRFLRIRAVFDRLTHGLFFVPSIFVVMSIVSAIAVVQIDRRVSVDSLPELLDSSQSNARTMLGVLAGGTITAASVVFSLTLVSVQLASSQYSPRTLYNFLGDRFQQIIIGIVIGTFSFCLMALRGVEGSGPDDEVFVPRITVATALVLGIVALFAVIASINHTASGLRVASIANRITDDVIGAIHRRFDDVETRPLLQTTSGRTTPDDRVDTTDAVEFTSSDRGWIQQMSIRLVAAAVPEGSTVRIVAAVGTYVQIGQPIMVITPVPDEAEAVHRALARSVVVGPHRTLQQDVAFGVIQLTDIALRALSPGVNDPQTAQEVLPRIGAVLTELAARDLTPASAEYDGRHIVRRSDLDHDGFVRLAIDPIRRAADDDPQVLAALLTVLATARDEARRRRADAVVEPFEAQARLVLDRAAGNRSDAEMVRDAGEVAGFC